MRNKKSDYIQELLNACTIYSRVNGEESKEYKESAKKLKKELMDEILSLYAKKLLFLIYDCYIVKLTSIQNLNPNEKEEKNLIEKLKEKESDIVLFLDHYLGILVSYCCDEEEKNLLKKLRAKLRVYNPYRDYWGWQVGGYNDELYQRMVALNQCISEIKLTIQAIKSKQEAAFEHSINIIQKNIIDATLGFIFDTIDELKPIDAIAALKAITSENFSSREILKFTEAGILHCIIQSCEILSHPFPQNRGESYPYVGQEAEYSMFKLERNKIKDMKECSDIELKNGRIIRHYNVVRNNSQKDDYIIAKEEIGLLSLTSREDDTTPPITREDIVKYVCEVVDKEIIKHQEKSVRKIQFWYRCRRDENKKASGLTLNNKIQANTQ